MPRVEGIFKGRKCQLMIVVLKSKEFKTNCMGWEGKCMCVEIKNNKELNCMEWTIMKPISGLYLDHIKFLMMLHI